MLVRCFHFPALCRVGKMSAKMDKVTTAGVQRIGDMLRGYYVAQAVYVAARLGIADLLARGGAGSERGAAGENGPGMTIEELAAATGCQTDGLYRMMRALAAEGLFFENPGPSDSPSTTSEERRFTLTAVGEKLRSDLPGSMRAAALIAGETQYKVWTLFKDAVKNGVPAFQRIFRQPLFDFLDEHPDVYALFNQAMTHRVGPIVAAVVEACDVRAGDVIVDVGGGLGSLLVALLENHPENRGILLDSEEVIAAARETLAPNAVANRLNFNVGDFLKSGGVPGGGIPSGDVMILASILHMFQDGEAGRILRNCHASLAPGGRIYLVERLLLGPNQADPGKWEDLNMLVMTGGRERTLDEFKVLLEGAGFTHIFCAGEAHGEGIVAGEAQ